jgi:hypothetical protein
MKTVASTSAAEAPVTISGGKPSGPLRPGSGKWHSASTLIAAMARADTPITKRRDRIVAATVTGARNRIENGFSSPPVR